MHTDSLFNYDHSALILLNDKYTKHPFNRWQSENEKQTTVTLVTIVAGDKQTMNHSESGITSLTN